MKAFAVAVSMTILAFVIAGCGKPHSGAGLSIDAVCDRYLYCAQHAMPSQEASLIAAYGNGSACWANASTTAACQSACEAGIDALGTGSCCESDADCFVDPRWPQSSLAHCSATTATCVQCVKSSDCTAPNGVCSPDHVCVPCTTTQGCSGATPVCSMYGEQPGCVECVAADDCKQGVCSTSHTCDDSCGAMLACVKGDIQDNDTWSFCIDDDRCCNQPSLPAFAALRACLKTHCDSAMPGDDCAAQYCANEMNTCLAK